MTGFDDVDDPLPESVPDMSIADFDPQDVANTTVSSHGDKVMAAIESAVWHTLIDGAAHEVFPPEFRPKYMREVIHRLEVEGFAKNDDTAFYAGVQAFDAIADYMDSIADDDVDEPGGGYHFEGYRVHKCPHAPEGVAIFVDANALYRVPPEVITRSLGLDSAATVSSPVGVKHPAGVAVVNIDVSGGDE